MFHFLDFYQREELEPSASTQLDIAGMQPHSREYLEHEINCMRTERKLEKIGGQSIDYPSGIQFTGSP